MKDKNGGGGGGCPRCGGHLVKFRGLIRDTYVCSGCNAKYLL